MMKERLHKLSLAILLASLLVVLGSNVFAAEAGKVFFSAYVEGGSYNKAVAIFNGYGVDLDLSNYEIWLYFNGSSTPSSYVVQLSGTLAPGEVFVVVHPDASQDFLDLANMTSSNVNFNGDDAVALVQLQDQDGATINQRMDIIGQIGFDPGSAWVVGGVSTLNMTLYRNATVSVGDMDGSDAFDPSVEWTAAAQDTFTGIDAFTPSGWTPTAVALSGLSATSPFAALAVGLLAAAGLVVLRKRK